MTTLMITGHRPNKLYGYDTSAEAYLPMRKWMRDKFDEFRPDRIISGMALGVDQIFCEEAITYRRTTPGVSVVAAIPCWHHSSKWRFESRQLYDALIANCNETVLVTDGPYTPQAMQDRNIWMVDRSDIVLAVWNGDVSGGTYNCLVYATKQKKRIHRFNPGGVK